MQTPRTDMDAPARPPPPKGAGAAIAPFAQYPALYAAADAMAERHQDRHQWTVRANLLLLAIAAAVGVFGPLVPSLKTWAGWASAAIIAAGFGLQIFARYHQADRSWFNGRALAEAVKGSSWRFVTGALPYDGPAETAEARFAGDLRRLREKYDDRGIRLHTLPDAAAGVTAAMRDVRALSLDARREQYLRGRADDQIAWYTGKAIRNFRMASRLWWFAQITQGAAIIGAVWRAPNQDALDVVTLLTTLTAVAAAWTQTSRHSDLASSYDTAANDLSAARDRIRAAADERALQEAIAAAEDAIAREQTVWVAVSMALRSDRPTGVAVARAQATGFWLRRM